MHLLLEDNEMANASILDKITLFNHDKIKKCSTPNKIKEHVSLVLGYEYNVDVRVEGSCGAEIKEFTNYLNDNIYKHPLINHVYIILRHKKTGRKKVISSFDANWNFWHLDIFFKVEKSLKLLQTAKKNNAVSTCIYCGKKCNTIW